MKSDKNEIHYYIDDIDSIFADINGQCKIKFAISYLKLKKVIENARMFQIKKTQRRLTMTQEDIIRNREQIPLCQYSCRMIFEKSC